MGKWSGQPGNGRQGVRADGGVLIICGEAQAFLLISTGGNMYRTNELNTVCEERCFIILFFYSLKI